MITGLAHKLDRATGHNAHPPVSLERVFRLPPWLPEAAPGTQPWDNNVVMRLSALCTWLIPVKASIQTFEILTGGCRKYACLSVNSLACSTPQLAIWSGLRLSIRSLPLPSVNRGQFQIARRKLSRKLQINNAVIITSQMRNLKNTANKWQDQAESHVSAFSHYSLLLFRWNSGRLTSLSGLTHSQQEGKGSLA